MEGLTDAPMREVQGAIGAFSFGVSEFLRVSSEVLSKKVVRRYVPELAQGGRTRSGLAVQVQLLGGHPERMALSARVAYAEGARAIDINFGCPAPTVNRHDGGATLLRHPSRIREIVAAVREALPADIPVSAKLRLGWDTLGAIDVNAAMAAEGGAAWLTIHGRTRVAGYRPPAYWDPIGRVREQVGIPVVANGDIWTIDDFRRCRDETGCRHFMLGRGALSNPRLVHQAAAELGLASAQSVPDRVDWSENLSRLAGAMDVAYGPQSWKLCVGRLKQWLKLAQKYGDFDGFDRVKLARSVDEVFEAIGGAVGVRA